MFEHHKKESPIISLLEWVEEQQDIFFILLLVVQHEVIQSTDL